MCATPTIRNFLYGSGAILLALVGQQRLESARLVEAALFYGLAVLLFLYGLRSFSLRLEILGKPLGGRSWQQGWPWLLVAAALLMAWFAMRNLQDVEHPTWDFWFLALAHCQRLALLRGCPPIGHDE
jgi:hypothetical protein